MRTFKALQTSYGHVKRFKEGLVSELKPIRERMRNLPKAITFPQFQFITAYNDDGEEDEVIGDISEQYFRKFASTSVTNKTFGLLPRLSLIRRLDCGIRMVSFTFGARKQK